MVKRDKIRTEPSIIPNIEIINTNRKSIALIQVQEYPIKPIALKGRYYSRRKNANHLLTVVEISDFLFKINTNITITELKIKTNLSRRGVEYQLKKLKEGHIIQRIGPAKGGYWEINAQN
ncbi:MAG TPA: hypothetical protein PLS94_09490 [Prolixibacteraceae bacterium]|nr:hypothetical protein [Prolixibacteraceae bacterium]